MSESNEEIRYILKFYNKKSVRMSGNPELYNKGNSPTRRDAIYYLERYKHKICFKSTGDRSIDIGCADGSITSIIRSYLPSSFEKIVATDINESMIAYAIQCYGDNRTMFRVLDIENEIPDDMTEGFDHVFSFYTLQWIKKQEQDHFRSLYDKLKSSEGQKLIYKLARSRIKAAQDMSKCRCVKDPGGNLLCEDLAVKERWRSYFHQLLNKQHKEEPDVIVEEMMEKIGFVSINVKCKQMHYAYRSIDVFKDKIRAINPFHAAGEEFEEFLDDCVNVARNMNMVAYSEDKKTEVVNNKYNLLVVYARKI
ncbi:hypothetical protein K1T71_012554 [Dendrolimus kikuchii]|uniref:Uncharacterized protein n=1 Tax=Dendrolimus kikuchii TaxID=765133 RepID=A0ACC1CJP9_9NEOP|nr:hypothetical protein K1T71_012554 [Dendrolimus kikuchii]